MREYWSNSSHILYYWKVFAFSGPNIVIILGFEAMVLVLFIVFFWTTVRFHTVNFLSFILQKDTEDKLQMWLDMKRDQL